MNVLEVSSLVSRCVIWRHIQLETRRSDVRSCVPSSMAKKVDLHVPNCELFGGRSSYKESVKESVSRLRIYFPRASLAQGCTANAVVEALGKDAHTNGWWAADSLRSAFRSMRVLMFLIS